MLIEASTACLMRPRGPGSCLQAINESWADPERDRKFSPEPQLDPPKRPTPAEASLCDFRPGDRQRRMADAEERDRHRREQPSMVRTRRSTYCRSLSSTACPRLGTPNDHSAGAPYFAMKNDIATQRAEKAAQNQIGPCLLAGC